MKKSLSNEIILRVELLEGTNIINALEKRYFTELLSYRKICKLWGVNNRTVAKIMSHCNKKPRTGSDAVKTQWINNNTRREQAAKVLSDTNHNLALKGLHVRQGKTKENSELIRRVSDKLKTSSSFLRADVRRKAQENSKKTRLLFPENNHFLKTEASKVENIMKLFLENNNIRYEFRYIVRGYFVNFYLPEFNLIIDLQGSNRFPFSFKRHNAIQKEGFNIVYCVNQFVEKTNFTDLYNYISSFYKLGLYPSITGQKSVIWGARNLFPFGKECNEISVKSIYMGGFHKLEITTTSN